MFVTNAGVRIYYEVEGTGPTILFHTGAGGDHRIWKYAGYVAALQGYRKILVDQRGRGFSDRPSTIESHRMEWFVSDVCAVLDDVGVESVRFWGYSNGALVGVAFGSAYPKRLRVLVGIGSLPFQNFSDLPRPVDPKGEIERMVSAGGVNADVKLHTERTKERFPEAIEKNVLGGDPLMYALDDLAWNEWRGPLEAYPTLHVPVLVVAGELEDSKRQTEKSITKLPNGRLVRIPGIGHLSAFYRSDLVLPHVLPFLEQTIKGDKS